MDVPPRPGLRAGGYGSHSPERAGQMGSGRGFALALRLPKGAPSHRRRWFHAPFAATRRLQQACEPAAPRWNRLEHGCQLCAPEAAARQSPGLPVWVCSGPAAGARLFVPPVYSESRGTVQE